MCYVSGLKMIDENGKDGFLIIISFDRPMESLFIIKKDGRSKHFLMRLKAVDLT